MSSSSTVLLVGPLVVTATGKAKDALYTVHASEQDMTEIKTTCFSELDRMHRLLAKEVPSFSGRLPAHRLKQFTPKVHKSSHFVENRRQTIEAYLRLVAAHDAARASDAWRTFFAGCAAFPSLASTSTTCPSSHAPQKDDEDCERQLQHETDVSDDSLPFRGTFEKETDVSAPLLKGSFNIDEVVLSKRRNLTAAHEEKKQLGTAFASREEAAVAAEAEVKVRAASESDATSHLVFHHTSLEDLATALATQKDQRCYRERQKHELAKRFSADLERTVSAATEAVSKAQMSYDVSRQACIDAAANMHSNLTTASAVKVAAEAEHAAATESSAAMTMAMTMLRERLKARLDDLQTAEREFENCKMAKDIAADENSEAEVLRRTTENEALKADAAVVSYTADAGRRNRVHEAEVRRARDRASNADALRDTLSRNELGEEDRGLLEPAENASNVAANGAAAELAHALQSHEKAQLKDERQLEVLRDAAAKASVNLETRRAIAEARAARLADKGESLLQALAKHTAALAVHKHIQQKVESLQQLVDGPLAEDLSSTAKLEEATKALAAEKKAGEKHESFLRRAAESDLQVLKRRQAEEAALLEAFDSAQIVAAEARDDITASAWEESREKDLACKLRSNEMQLVDCEKVVREAAVAHKLASEELAAAMREMPDASLRDSDDDRSFDDDGDSSVWQSTFTDGDAEDAATAPSPFDDASRHEREECQARLVVRIEGLEHVLREKQAALQAATAAVTAAKKELAALLALQKETPRLTEKLLDEELALVGAGLQTHREKESSIAAEVEQIGANWTKAAAFLDANIHRAQLRVAFAAKDVEASKHLAHSLAAEPALPTPGGEVLEVRPGAGISCFLWDKLVQANSLTMNAT